MTRTQPEGHDHAIDRQSPHSVQIEREITGALIRMAFARLRLSVIMTVVVIGLFVGLLWPHFPESLMWPWLSVLLAVAVARYAMWAAFTRASAEAQTQPWWRHIFVVAAICAGCSWSFGAVTLMPGPGATESMLLSLTVIAVTAVSMVTLTAHLPAMFGFQVAALGPTAWALFNTGGEVEQLAAMIVLAGTIILMIVGRESGASTRSLLATELRLSVAFAETEEARTRAEAASDAKSQFLATMSHEIRTPMNGVLGMTELLLASGQPAQQRQWTEAVHASGQHLLGVINDILDFSKIESGHLDLEAVDFSLIDVVEEAVAMFAQPAGKKGLELAAAFTPGNDGLRVRGDPFRLRQVVANLIGNAVKFTATGEVIIRVEQANDGGPEKQLRISIRDTGIGISREAVERIFDDFSQADGSTTRQYGGTGLGLAISRRLLHLMGGTLVVASEPGKGSTFTINLRLPSASATTAPVPADTPLHGVRVLIVDDHATHSEILRDQLASWGMQADCAAGGASALDTLLEARIAGDGYDLAILDLSRDGQAGLAQAIRAESTLAGTPLLLLVSSVRESAGDGGCLSGTGQQLHKPVRRHELRRCLLDMLATGTPATLPPPTAPSPAADGLLAGSVLLVEDNDINQVLAEAMLGRLGLSWTLVANGAEAVAAVQSAHFDLVLMDCQMPVMDGFEATRIIRALPDRQRSQVPIIALTANAMQGDDLACQEAGMNDFLAKPYSLQALRNMLQRWLEPAAGTAGGRHEPGDCALPAESTHSPVLDPKALQALRDLDESGGETLLLRIASSFQAAADVQLSKLEAAVAAGDADGIRHTAHTWKSSAANIGAGSLGALLRDLEQCARQRQLDRAPLLLRQISVHKARTVAALETLRTGRT